ncbi:MAG: hypothetical protein IJZ90_01890, partial [Clostridia bacterium]|nr:hypothetical protein [Clostridia bacterium]
TTNDAYKWWICNNFKQITETLHGMDIHLPVYASKALYGNMGLFKHALLGRYTGHEERCFIIVGIPVRNLPPANTSTGPARPMKCAKFYNNTGFKGYLLFYIDYVTTAMVKAVVV